MLYICVFPQNIAVCIWVMYLSYCANDVLGKTKLYVAVSLSSPSLHLRVQRLGETGNKGQALDVTFPILVPLNSSRYRDRAKCYLHSDSLRK